MNVSTVLFMFMLLAAVMMVFSEKLIHSLIALSVFSTLLTIQYAFLKAPDVAITEAALGAGLSTLVYLTAIRKTTRVPQAPESETQPPRVQEGVTIALTDFLVPENIHLIEATNRNQIFQDVLHHGLHDMDPSFVQAVTHGVLSRRRRDAPLDIQLCKGFALVHARHDQCPEVRVALGLLPTQPTLYKGEPIHTVVGIVLPYAQSRRYLAFLARFGRLVSRDDAESVFEEAGRLYAAGKAQEAQQQLIDYIHAFEES